MIIAALCGQIGFNRTFQIWSIWKIMPSEMKPLMRFFRAWTMFRTQQ